MNVRTFAVSVCVCAMLAGSAAAQDKPGTPAERGGAMGASLAKEIQGLTSDDFAERQAALRRLEQVAADQIRQRTAIQEALLKLQEDLAQQERALAMVADEEAQARVAGLLEMERGLAGWTIQTMSETAPRRQALLAWGLGKNATIVARLYSQNKHVRVEAIKALAKMEGDGADWTLGRLINDEDATVRATAMSVCWNRSASAEVVGALWTRAVSGPLHYAEIHGARAGDTPDDVIRVDFPDGEPLEFTPDEDQSSFSDSQLAGAVLVHMNSPLVAERIRALLSERVKAGKTLSLADDPDWTLVTHRLVETYKIKEAIPLLAEEALSTDSESMGGDMNGRPFVWSGRTMAIGTLCRLIEQDTAQFNLIHVRDSGETRGWTWATDVNPMAGAMGNMPEGDGVVVRAFYPWWKAHHAEYGVKEEPSDAGVPPEPRPGRGRGLRGRPMPVEPPQIQPPAEGAAPTRPAEGK